MNPPHLQDIDQAIIKRLALLRKHERNELRDPLSPAKVKHLVKKVARLRAARLELEMSPDEASHIVAGVLLHMAQETKERHAAVRGEMPDRFYYVDEPRRYVGRDSDRTFFDAHCCNNPGDGRGFVWSTSKSDLELRPKEKKAFRRLHAAWKIKIAD